VEQHGQCAGRRVADHIRLVQLFTESPAKTRQATQPGTGTWLDATGQTTRNIRGNNVAASLDADANKAVALQTLLYLNNKTHDILLAAGFTEAKGTFQTTHFTGSALGNDAVQAEAQDGWRRQFPLWHGYGQG